MSHSDDENGFGYPERPDSRLTRKSFLSTTAAAGLGLAAAACGSSSSSSATQTASSAASARENVTLHDITYVNWIGNKEFANFARETGISISQVAANSSDDRLAKIQSDPHAGDFVLADLGFAGRLNGLGLLATLDLTKIPNAQLVDAPFRFDLASASRAKIIPTDYGRSGILYRPDKIPDRLESWADFFKLAPKYSDKVSMLDFSDGTLPIALIALGYSTNTTEAGQINQAADLLIKTKPHVLAFITGDEAKPLLDGSAWMGQVEDFAAAPALASDKKLKWVDPIDKIHGYIEGWGTLAASPHIPETLRFYNYHLQPKVAANFANSLSIAPIERAAVPYLAASITTSPITNPSPAVLQRIEFKRFVGTAQQLYDQAWVRFKSA